MLRYIFIKVRNYENDSGKRFLLEKTAIGYIMFGIQVRSRVHVSQECVHKSRCICRKHRAEGGKKVK
jgi:hypothetical protein